VFLACFSGFATVFAAPHAGASVATLHGSKAEKRGTACDAMGAANTPCDAKKTPGSKKKHRQKIPNRGARWPHMPGFPLISAARAATLAKAAETAARKPLPCAMLARWQHGAPGVSQPINHVSPGPLPMPRGVWVRARRRLTARGEAAHANNIPLQRDCHTVFPRIQNPAARRSRLSALHDRT
jgi:hypothetical protein